jgi:tetrahydromethanopterin S-methyltransferase subunit G
MDNFVERRTHIELTDRERLIAKEAAKIALEEMSSEFYKKVGKTVVEKILILVGLLVVGFVFGKGWIVKL